MKSILRLDHKPTGKNPGRRAVPVLRLCLIIALCLGAAPALAENPNTFEAVGSSRIYKGDVQSARQAAITDSFDMALTLAVTATLPHDVFTSHFQAVSQGVFGKADAYVQEFQVLAESQTGDHLRVMTRVRLDQAAIQEALRQSGALTASGALPVLLFLINEQKPGQATPGNWWGKAVSQALVPRTETLMAAKMAGQGFTTVDGRDAIRALVSSPQFNPDRFDLAQAMTLAQNAGAQVIILGSSSAQYLSNIQATGLRSCEITVSVQAINAATGEQVAVSNQTYTALSAEGAPEDSEETATPAARAAQELAAALIAAYKPQAQGPVTIEMRVSGISPMANYVAFRKALKEETAGVTRVLPKGMTDVEAMLMVEFDGLPQTLARELQLKAFENFSINISYIGAGQMDVDLIPKASAP